MPKPWPQHQARTIFLRVPRVDWAAVRGGYKREFRAAGQVMTQAWAMDPPCPVVAFSLSNIRTDHDSALMVLESTWREPLGAISDESLTLEGFASRALFRRYWMERHSGERFRPMLTVQVYRLRPWDDQDAQGMGLRLLERLYREHLPVTA